MNILTLTLGPLATNCYLVWQNGRTDAVIIDPAANSRKITAALQEHGLTPVCFLLTHAHFDHIGALKPLLAAADKVKGFVCVELNMGQMKQDVELAIRCKKPVSLCRRVGGMIPTPDEVLASIKTMAEGGANA